MSEQEHENQDPGTAAEPGMVEEEQLPEDLRATEDNPLARHPDETGEEGDRIGSDREGDPETAPLTEDEADYGG